MKRFISVLQIAEEETETEFTKDVKGKTIFFVSHSTGQVSEFCNKVLWLEYGMIKAYGKTEEIIPMYENFTTSFNKMSREEQKNYKKEKMEFQQKLFSRK